MSLMDDPRYHYPVTTTFWRGLIIGRPFPGRLRRACDWKTAVLSEVRQYQGVTCSDCLAYARQLNRLGAFVGLAKVAMADSPEKP